MKLQRTIWIGRIEEEKTRDTQSVVYKYPERVGRVSNGARQSR